jgi:hypothetical protein
MLPHLEVWQLYTLAHDCLVQEYVSAQKKALINASEHERRALEEIRTGAGD